MGAVKERVGSRIGKERRSRSTRQDRAESLSERTNLLSDSADLLKAQIIEIENIRGVRSREFDNVKDITSPDLKEDERLLLKSNMLQGLITLLKSRINVKYSYLRLFSILIFFCTYSTTVIIQRNISDSFGVQSRSEK